MSNIDTQEAVSRFTQAIGNVSIELVAAGVDPLPLAAGIRIEAGKIETDCRPSGMVTEEGELIALARRCHEFVNTMQVAGLEERTVATCLLNTSVERVTRLHGAPAAAAWLRGMADMVEKNAESFERTARQH